MLNERTPIERSTCESDQCLAQTTRGQCLMRKLDGVDYCQMHSGQNQLAAKQKADIYDLHRSSFLSSEKDLDRHKYDLSAELGVTRMMLQQYLTKIQDHDTLFQYDTKVMNLIDKIQKLSDSVLRADQKLGTLMCEEDAMAIGQGLIDVVHEILNEHIEDPEVFAAAMSAVGEAFEKVINERGSDKT